MVLAMKDNKMKHVCVKIFDRQTSLDENDTRLGQRWDFASVCRSMWIVCSSEMSVAGQLQVRQHPASCIPVDRGSEYSYHDPEAILKNIGSKV